MSKWQFEHMTEEDAHKILGIGKRLDERDLSADTYGDRITARRLLERRFADDGVSPPPLKTFAKSEAVFRARRERA